MPEFVISVNIVNIQSQTVLVDCDDITNEGAVLELDFLFRVNTSVLTRGEGGGSGRELTHFIIDLADF